MPWYEANARDLPWRRTKDPYHVWSSEVMLQQTRVEAVIRYYSRFLQELPDIKALSRVPETGCSSSGKDWDITAGQRISGVPAEVIMQSGGAFPRDYEGIRSLPGVGEYTADAVASICFNMPTPAVDGNVLRLMARLTALKKSCGQPKGAAGNPAAPAGGSVRQTRGCLRSPSWNWAQRSVFPMGCHCVKSVRLWPSAPPIWRGNRGNIRFGRSAKSARLKKKTGFFAGALGWARGPGASAPPRACWRGCMNCPMHRAG